MTAISTERLHASCVAIRGRAVLIEGLPGVGKSDLALRLIDRGAVLVSDDQTIVTRQEGGLIASAPATIAGKIEVRGLGIVAMHAARPSPVALLVSLGGDIQRMPLEKAKRRLAGIDVPVVAIAAFDASSPIKVELALREFGIGAPR